MERIYLEDFPGTKYRISLVREDNSSASSDPISAPERAYQYIKSGLENKDRELFVTILLNAKNVPLGVHLVSMGALNSAFVSPREVFKAAIIASAAGIILAHNHPSGDPEPSLEDVQITVTLSKAGDILGVSVVDHIIVGHGTYYSMQENGHIRDKLGG